MLGIFILLAMSVVFIVAGLGLLKYDPLHLYDHEKS